MKSKFLVMLVLTVLPASYMLLHANKNAATYVEASYLERLEKVNKKLAEYPDNYHYWCEKGELLAMTGKTNEALECYNKAIEIDTSIPKAWYAKGFICMASNQYEDAAFHFGEVIKLEPGNYSAWEGKAAALQGMGKQDEADLCFAKAKELKNSFGR